MSNSKLFAAKEKNFGANEIFVLRLSYERVRHFAVVRLVSFDSS